MNLGEAGLQILLPCGKDERSRASAQPETNVLSDYLPVLELERSAHLVAALAVIKTAPEIETIRIATPASPRAFIFSQGSDRIKSNRIQFREVKVRGNQIVKNQ